MDTHCNVILIIDGNVSQNLLFSGDEKESYVGSMAENKAVELFTKMAKDYDCEYDPDAIADLIEDGVLETHNKRVKVTISWPIRMT